jgi:ribosomal protein S3
MYKTRFKIWFYISRILFENLKTLIQRNKYINLKLSYFGLTNVTPTAAMLANYINKKLYQKYTIFEILKPLVVDLATNFTIDGFKVSCAGRLSKKQRASLFVQKMKKVPTNTFDSFIDYATTIVRFRHGICGLKIWITRKKTYKSFEYNFSYNYNLN